MKIVISNKGESLCNRNINIKDRLEKRMVGLRITQEFIKIFYTLN